MTKVDPAAIGRCAEQVRRLDPDRFLILALAPARHRDVLAALCAFHVELALIPDKVSEALLGRMRFQWWREALEAIADGRPPRHDTAEALAILTPLPLVELTAMIDAREQDLRPDGPAPGVQAVATAGRLGALIAEVLGGDSEAIAAARHAGTAYGLAGEIRRLPWDAARGRIRLPAPLLAAHGVRPADLVRGRHSPELAALVRELADQARGELDQVRRHRVPRRIRAALIPARQAAVDLRRLARRDHDPRPLAAAPRPRAGLILGHWLGLG